MSDSLRTVVVETPNEALGYYTDWDALAVAHRQPYCSPAWMLSWWEHVAPAGTALRLTVVHDSERVIGVAPFFLERGRFGMRYYRLLGAGLSTSLLPMAEEGRDRDVCASVAQALHARDGSIHAIFLEGVPGDSPWPALLAECWPAKRPLNTYRVYSQEAPFIALSERTCERWLDSRGPKLRRNLRRARRQLARHGGMLDCQSSADTLEARVRAFARLHQLRWQRHGRPGMVDAAVEHMMLAAGRLLPHGRFRICFARMGDAIVGAYVVVAAGGRACAWLSGFDESESRVDQPGLLAALGAVEESFRVADVELDFGPGAQWYKTQLADEARTCDWIVLGQPGWRGLVARSRLLSTGIRVLLARRLTPGQKKLLRRLTVRRGDRILRR